MVSVQEYRTTKRACYLTNVSMSVVACLSPLLFVTFREQYGFSYTLLGLLVVVNYVTQLLIDLVFTLFPKYFNLEKTVRSMPLLTFFGFLIYAIMPAIFPSQAYFWIAAGTVVFSVSSGLNEVLASPVIAAIPSDDPEREMSKLHSLYSWGVAAVVVISTVFLKLVGRAHWQLLALLWSILPLYAYLVFRKAPIPHMDATAEKSSGKIKAGAVVLCTVCIFLGGASEMTMTQWASGFVENAIGISKVWGDLLGVAVFAVLAGLGRTLYAKYQFDVINVMLFGMLGATVCYFTAAVSLNPAVSLIACAACGICISMLWPGTIICVGEKLPGAGVAIYALMAAGGDMGASVAPQMVGVLSDHVSVSGLAARLSETLAISAEQIGMRAGLLSATAFPLLGIFVLLAMKRYFKKR